MGLGNVRSLLHCDPELIGYKKIVLGALVDEESADLVVRVLTSCVTQSLGAIGAGICADTRQAIDVNGRPPTNNIMRRGQAVFIRYVSGVIDREAVVDAQRLFGLDYAQVIYWAKYGSGSL
jgi:hypothetical protein